MEPSLAADFSVRAFKPCMVQSPLLTNGVRFVSDADTILLDPSRFDTAAATEGSVDNLHLSTVFGSAKSGASLEADRVQLLQLAGPRRKLYFDPSKTTAGMVTCGGVCPGLNNVVRAMVNVLFYRYGVKSILGFKYGFQGITPNQPAPVALTPEAVKDVHLMGGTMLGTSRGPQDIKSMANQLLEHKVDILFCIGGDGTQRGAHALANEIMARDLRISIIGVGKTIDNDLLFLDRSFGFETAVQLSQQAIISAHEEARSTKNGIGIVKLMGRESGAIALHASLASGDVNVVLVPEVQFRMDDLIKYLVERFKTRDHCLIVCAEGAGQNLLPTVSGTDKSGNRLFSDIGECLKKEIGARLKDLKVEHSIKYIDPSYSIRAGVANASDAILCTMYAQMAVHAAMAGKTDCMVGMMHGQFVHLPLERVTAGKKNVDVRGQHWQAFLDATGSPFSQ